MTDKSTINAGLADPSALMPVHPKYRPDIDGLRALAVLAVVGFHAFPYWVEGGFIGVDIFFVISGYLISTIIFQNLTLNRFSFIDFYKRRIKRIFPALILMLFTICALGWFFLLADEYQQLGKHIAAGIGFISNLVLWNESGYFDNAADTKPLLHLWSLGIEEQFYIIWPALLYFAYKKRRHLLAITMAIATVSFVLNIWLLHSNTVATFYSPFTRIWELLIGAGLAHYNLFNPKALQRYQLNNIHLQSMFGATLIIAGLLLITRESPFPGYLALLPTMGAAILIASGPQAWINRILLSNPLMVGIGLISYPLYLWHWPMLVMARILEGGVPSSLIRLKIVLASIALAWLTYRLIERPLRISKSNISIIILLIMALLVATLGIFCQRKSGFPMRDIVKNDNASIIKVGNLHYVSCPNNKLLRNSRINYCAVGKSGEITAAIVGDSHAYDKFDGIVNYDQAHNWIVVGNGSCPPVLDIRVEIKDKECQEKQKNILTWVVNEKNIKLVLLAFYGQYFLTTSYAADHMGESGPDRTKISSTLPLLKDSSREEIFFYGLNEAVSTLLAAGKTVVIAVDIPELPFVPRDCIRKNIACSIPINQVMQRMEPHRAMLNRIKLMQPSVRIYDPINLFCNKFSCQFRNDQTVLYKDSHHLTTHGSFLYGKQFVEWLSESTPVL